MWGKLVNCCNSQPAVHMLILIIIYMCCYTYTHTYTHICMRMNGHTHTTHTYIHSQLPFLELMYQLLFAVCQLSLTSQSTHIHVCHNAIDRSSTGEPTLSLVNAILSAKCAASLSFESFNIFSIVLDNVSM